MGIAQAVEDGNCFDDFGTKYTDHVLFKVVCTGTINHHPLRVCSNKLQAENRATKFRADKYCDKRGMRCLRNEILIEEWFDIFMRIWGLTPSARVWPYFVLLSTRTSKLDHLGG
ncbi:unnamed protein product [Allacma fusca]|uniref:Uncharacterized protein n=1 Tax=Allacma fusca TaxID=39272 RepID=A0A8J2NYT0_9HEXA|nr:unnamed protein product [Allacma fusca]